MSGVQRACLMCRVGLGRLLSRGMAVERQLSFRLPLSEAQGNAKGSAASLSGLVQLPPVDGKEVELLEEDSDELEKMEQAEVGRLMLSPGLTSSLDPLSRAPCCAASNVVKICASGVFGGEMNRRLDGIGASSASSSCVFVVAVNGSGARQVSGVSMVGIGTSCGGMDEVAPSWTGSNSRPRRRRVRNR